MTDSFISLSHPLFDAIILRQGAQLIHFQPKNVSPFLWSAKLSTFEKGKAFRGGIPICWPWFGKEGTPSHGFARLMEWQLIENSKSEAGITLCFELTDSPMTRLLWPYAFRATLKMQLTEEINLSLHVNAEHESTAALHTYLTCKNIFDVDIEGLGAVYKDALQNGTLCESKTKSLHVTEGIDRVYTMPHQTTVVSDSTTRLQLSHEHHSDVVVWNPWKEGSANLPDMDMDDYKKMICVETARISKPLACEDSLHVRIHRL